MFFLWQSKMNQDRNVTIGTTFFTFKSKRRNVAVLLLHLCFYQIFLSGKWPSSRAHTELIIKLIWRMSILHSPFSMQCGFIVMPADQRRSSQSDGQSPVSRVQSARCRHCPPCPLQEVMCRCGRTAVMPRPAGGGAALQCCSWCARRLQCQAAARAGTRASHAAAPPPGLGPRTVRQGEI